MVCRQCWPTQPKLSRASPLQSFEALRLRLKRVTRYPLLASAESAANGFWQIVLIVYPERQRRVLNDNPKNYEGPDNENRGLFYLRAAGLLTREVLE